jgi:hypothetical protein
VVAKAQLYDQLVEAKDPTSTKQAIPVLVKYSRWITNLFAEIQKIIPPTGIPRRVLYQGSPGSPSGTLYEVVGEVTVLQDPPAEAEPSQQRENSRSGSSGKDPILRSKTEEYRFGGGRICEVRTRTVTGS